MTPFNPAAIHFAWLPVLPLIAVAVGAIGVLLAGVHLEDDDSEGLGFLTLVTLLAAFILTIFTIGQNTLAFGGSLATDDYSAFFELTILVVSALTVAMLFSA